MTTMAETMIRQMAAARTERSKKRLNGFACLPRHLPEACLKKCITMRLLKSAGKTAGWTMIGALVLLSACQNRKIDRTMMVEPERPVSFSQDIQPILTASCGGGACHLDRRTSGVRLSTYQQVTSSVGVQYGEEIVAPGDAAASPLLDKLRASPRFGARMPQGRPPLSQREIALIRVWINEGALDN